MRVAKSLGYVVIAVDRDPCAIGFKYSDVQINRITHDVDGIIKVLEQLVEKYKLDKFELLTTNAIIAANNRTRPLAASSLKNHLNGLEI